MPITFPHTTAHFNSVLSPAGHCKEFKWEWWSHSKETKDHYK